MISIVLIEPAVPGNIGAIARVMKNFDLKRLVLINPKCDHLEKESIDRACHAKDILKKARVGKIDILKGFDCVIGTTARLGTDYNIPRCPLTPDQLAEKMNTKGKDEVAIVFGRESTGLSNKEIELCDLVVSIPTSAKYPAMNISHSCAIVLYEIYKRHGENKINRNIGPITRAEKDQIARMFNDILDSLPFETKVKKETQASLWQRIVGKSFMTKREAYAMMGFLNKVMKKIKG